MSYKSEFQSNNADLQTILDTVNALPEAGPQLPELTNPASASDIVSGKEVIGADGSKMTGTVLEKKSGESLHLSGSMASLSQAVTTLAGDVLFRKGASARLSIDNTKFGNATAADVAAGKTFTSERGLKLTGTASVGGGLETVSVSLRDANDVGTCFCYIDGTGAGKSVLLYSESLSVSVAKGSFLVVDYMGSGMTLSAPSTFVNCGGDGRTFAVLKVNGSGTVSVR